MKALIYIELIENITHSYEKEIIEWAKSKYSDLTVFDFDNLSEVSMIQYAMQLIESSDRVVIIINSEYESAGTKILALIEKIIKHKQTVKVILNGENKILMRMLSLLGNNFLHDLTLEAQKEIMGEFFES